VNHAHAASAAAESRLDDQRETDFLGSLQRFIPLFNCLFRARQGRHADFLRQGAGGGLVAHHPEQVLIRPHKGDAGLHTSPGELGIFREESIAGVDKIHALFLSQRHDSGNVQIRADRPLALADDVGLIGLETVDGKAVLLRIDGDGAKPELSGGAENTDGNLAAVGDEQFSLT